MRNYPLPSISTVEAVARHPSNKNANYYTQFGYNTIVNQSQYTHNIITTTQVATLLKDQFIGNNYCGEIPPRSRSKSHHTKVLELNKRNNR